MASRWYYWVLTAAAYPAGVYLIRHLRAYCNGTPCTHPAKLNHTPSRRKFVMAATKKSEASSATVEVSVPVGPTPRQDVFRAALNAAREGGDLPLTAPSNFDYEIVGEPSGVKDGARTYKVKVSWVDDEGEPVSFEEHEAALAVPTAVPQGDK
jgi:hypothetical protein